MFDSMSMDKANAWLDELNKNTSFEDFDIYDHKNVLAFRFETGDLNELEELSKNESCVALTNKGGDLGFFLFKIDHQLGILGPYGELNSKIANMVNSPEEHNLKTLIRHYIKVLTDKRFKTMDIANYLKLNALERFRKFGDLSDSDSSWNTNSPKVKPSVTIDFLNNNISNIEIVDTGTVLIDNVMADIPNFQPCGLVLGFKIDDSYVGLIDMVECEDGEVSYGIVTINTPNDMEDILEVSPQFNLFVDSIIAVFMGDGFKNIPFSEGCRIVHLTYKTKLWEKYNNGSERS